MRRRAASIPSRFKNPLGYPRLLGAYVAVNALPDVWMLVDSADCGTLRAEIIHDNHDWNSTLLREDGRYRIASSGVCPATIVMDRSPVLSEQLKKLDSQPGQYVVIYPAPITALLGIDYGNVVAGLKEQLTSTPIIINPVDAALGGCLDGYQEITEALAKVLPLPQVEPRPGTVALVGYFWDRNEADHAANVAELTRLLEGLGLTVSATWLSGVSTESLADVAHAETLIALPYAGQTARILAQRTGARVVETALPLGPGGTVRWLETVAAATGREEALARLLAVEAASCYRDIAKAVSGHFLNRPFALASEPVATMALAAMVRELGGRIEVLGTWEGSGPPAEALPAQRVAATMEDLGEEIAQLTERAPDAVCMGNELALATLRGLPIVAVPFGFQSGGFHHLHPAPFLGFAGARHLVDQVVNATTLYRMMHSE